LQTAADEKPTIPIIVKDATSIYWQTVLAGARKAGKDFKNGMKRDERDEEGQVNLLRAHALSLPSKTHLCLDAGDRFSRFRLFVFSDKSSGVSGPETLSHLSIGFLVLFPYTTCPFFHSIPAQNFR